MSKRRTAKVSTVGRKSSGYLYEYEGKRNWRSSSDDRWATEAGGAFRGRLLGYRRIDGAECAVVKLSSGKIVAVTRQSLDS